jgi:ABC-type bacteriocin/lantibiotic exporter with double-glycine peptidase domain
MRQQTVDFLASLSANAEALIHSDAVILPNFPKSIQLDEYSCGAKSVYCILKYFGKRCTPRSVERLLDTDEDGTDISDIKRVFKRYHLNCRIPRKPGLRDLKTAIDDDCPILITLYDDEHYSVVYGYSSGHIFVINPSLDFTEDGVGSLRCAVSKSEFRKIFDRWGIVIFPK